MNLAHPILTLSISAIVLGSAWAQEAHDRLTLQVS